MKRRLTGFAVLSALWLYALAVGAQSGGPYDLTWSTIDGGGATFSIGGTYIVGGTVGQPAASGLSGAPYVLSGGFWAGLVTGVTPPPPACIGDCGGGGEVTVDELLTMVNIALGNESVLECRVGDGNDDNRITVDEILEAIFNALNGC